MFIISSSGDCLILTTLRTMSPLAIARIDSLELEALMLPRDDALQA
jgi:hypothetical protein